METTEVKDLLMVLFNDLKNKKNECTFDRATLHENNLLVEETACIQRIAIYNDMMLKVMTIIGKLEQAIERAAQEKPGKRVKRQKKA